MTSDLSPRTRVTRASIGTDTAHGAVVPPLHLSSNFTFAGFEQPRKYDYTRSGNPTRDALGSALADLEGGVGAVVTSSGMSAITLVCQLLEPGDLLLAPHDCYGGSFRLFSSLAEKGSFQVEFVDQTDPRALTAAFSRGPKLVWVETPSNPLLRITDIEQVAHLCKRHDATLCVDNTFLSPVLQQPLSLGADLVVHSTTKYLNGHSDVVGGVAIARDEKNLERLQFWGNCLGLTGAPFDSFLTLRGLRTLHVRIRQHEENTRHLVETLQAHRAVRKVYYPGLASHEGHELAARQQHGFGGMLSFELAGGVDAVRTFVENLNCFSLAESLGGVESLVAHPASMTHAAMAPEARRRAGIHDSLIRMSVGIESAEDLAADVVAALDATLGSARRLADPPSPRLVPQAASTAA